MIAAAEAPTSTITINGARIELIDRGRGRPILFLHPHIGLDPSAPVLAMLAEGGRLIAPSHPGFGHSERPAGITTVDDLAYCYLDLMEVLDLRDALVIGVSLGAWIAAAIAVKSTAQMERLVLGNPVGIKVGDRQTRDILDIFAMPEPEFLEKAFADPAAGNGGFIASDGPVSHVEDEAFRAWWIVFRHGKATPARPSKPLVSFVKAHLLPPAIEQKNPKCEVDHTSLLYN
jgi:pimeloyl-ACP methyl ester carboxylesterase